MIAIILIIILYVLPGGLMYLFARMAHSENGIWHGDEFDITLFWVMICPILNILGVFAVWSQSPINGELSIYGKFKKFIAEKLFNIK